MYSRYYRLRNDRCGWKFVWSTEPLAGYKHCPPDASQVGTRLKDFFQKFGYVPTKGCNCEYLTQMFNEANLELLQTERQRAVDLIVNSAKMTGAKPNRWLVDWVLGRALKKEAERIGRGEGNGVSV